MEGTANARNQHANSHEKIHSFTSFLSQTFKEANAETFRLCLWARDHWRKLFVITDECDML